MLVRATHPAGYLQGHPVLCTQHVPAQASAACASKLQHSSSCSYVNANAAHGASLCPSLTSLSTSSCTALTQPQTSQALFPSHSFTSSAVQGQDISRSAISGSPLLPSQAYTSAQADVFQTIAKGWHRQYIPGQGSLLLFFLAHKSTWSWECRS